MTGVQTCALPISSKAADECPTNAGTLSPRCPKSVRVTLELALQGVNGGSVLASATIRTKGKIVKQTGFGLCFDFQNEVNTGLLVHPGTEPIVEVTPGEEFYK